MMIDMVKNTIKEKEEDGGFVSGMRVMSSEQQSEGEGAICMCVLAIHTHLVFVQGGESAVTESHRDEPRALVHLAHLLLRHKRW